MKKQKTYWVVENGEPQEVVLVGKYVSHDEWFDSKFKYLYQVRNASRNYADEKDVKREQIYLKRKEAELAISAAINLQKIKQAEEVIKKYKSAVEVIQKAKKDGLTDIDFVFELTMEEKKA